MSERSNQFLKRRNKEISRNFFNYDGSKSTNFILKLLIKFFYKFIKVLRIFDLKYPEEIRLNRKLVKFSSLPKAFDTFKILHISDTHFDLVNGIENKIYEIIKFKKFDVCFFTGDLSEDNSNYRESLRKFIFSFKDTRFKHGIYCVLGNHDSIQLYSEYKKHKINILFNESTKINKNRSSIIISGIDDSSFFFDKQNLLSLNEEKDRFKIILSHTPELIDIFEEKHFDLCCCGHTHGGQIILPYIKFPLFTGLCRFKNFYRGLQKYKSMQVHTSVGVGASIIPLRINCDPEISMLELRKN